MGGKSSAGSSGRSASSAGPSVPTFPSKYPGATPGEVRQAKQTINSLRTNSDISSYRETIKSLSNKYLGTNYGEDVEIDRETSRGLADRLLKLPRSSYNWMVDDPLITPARSAYDQGYEGRRGM